MSPRRLVSRALFLVIVAALTLLAVKTLDTTAAARGGRGSGNGTYFFGLLHQPLGGAGLALDPLGRLVISNIGSSGQDGVSIELSQAAPPEGQSPGWAAVMDFGAAGALPAGASVVVQPRDQFDNPLASLQLFETGGGHTGVGLVPDMCASCSVTVQTVLAGVVVQTAQFLPPLPATLASGNIGSNGGNGVEVRAQRKKVFVNNFNVELGMRLPVATPITLSSGLPPTDGDELRVSLNGLPPGTRYIGNLSVTGGNTGPITVRGEALLKTSTKGKVKFFNEAKGFGRMIGGGDVDGDGDADIIVSNIGSSGQDGVAIKRFGIGDTAPAYPFASVSAECDWGDAGALPAGSSMKFVIGNDAPVVRTYALEVHESGGGLATVSAIPCNEPGCCQPCCPCAGVVVEALRNGVLVDRVVHALLPPVVAVGNIGSSGNDGVEFFASLIDSCANLLDDRYLLGLRCPAAASLTLTGSAMGPVTADTVRVHITPADALGQLGSPRLLASGVSEFTLLNGEDRREFVTDMTYAGLPHDALGDASLGMTADGRLLVSNIGSSGNDGVAISLGDAMGASVLVGLGPGGGLPQGMQFSAGEPSNCNNDVNKFMINETLGGLAGVAFVQDTCPTCPLQVELLLNGHVVRSATYPPPYPATLVTGAIGSSGAARVKVVLDRATGRSRLHNPVPTPMRLSGPGQAPVSADCVRVSITGLPVGPSGAGASSLELQARSIPELDVSDDTIQMYGHGHRIQDQATFCVEKDAIRIGNIGSSGNDGVAIDPPDEDCDGVADPADRITVTYNNLVLPATGKHAINTKGTGAQGGLAGAAFFDVFVDIERLSGATENVDAFSAGLGSTTHTVRVYSNGALVSTHTGVGSLLAVIPAGHALQSAAASRSATGGLEHTLRWSQTGGPFAFTIPGQAPVLGDELRVSPEAPTMSVSAITSMVLTGQNLGAFTLIDEAIALTNTCPADENHDDSVDVNDLLAVIGAWGPCPGPCPPRCAADIAPALTGDCQVDVNDLLMVIGAWGPCP